MGVFHLKVIRDFGQYKRGDRIDADADVERVLNSEAAVHVVKVLNKVSAVK